MFNIKGSAQLDNGSDCQNLNHLAMISAHSAPIPEQIMKHRTLIANYYPYFVPIVMMVSFLLIVAFGPLLVKALT